MKNKEPKTEEGEETNKQNFVAPIDLNRVPNVLGGEGRLSGSDALLRRKVQPAFIWPSEDTLSSLTSPDNIFMLYFGLGPSFGQLPSAITAYLGGRLVTYEVSLHWQKTASDQGLGVRNLSSKLQSPTLPTPPISSS